MAAARVIRRLAVAFGVVITPGARQALKSFDKDVQKVKGDLEDAAQAAVRLGVAWVGAIAAALGGSGRIALQAAEQAQEIERAAAGLNLTKREYQELISVVGRFGVDASTAADALLQVNEAADRAVHGSSEMVQNFAAIGIRVDQLRGKNPAQLLEIIADALASASDRGAALATMSRLLGEEASRKLGPALMRGAAGIRAMRAEARRLGVVMDEDAIRTGAQLADQWGQLKEAARGLRNEIGLELAPTVLRAVRGAKEWIIANREWLGQRTEDAVRRLTFAAIQLDRVVRGFGGWDTVLAGVAGGAGMLALLANLGRIQAMLTTIIASGRVLGTMMKLFAAAAGVSLSPLLALLAGLVFYAGLLALGLQDLWVWWQGGESVMKSNLDALERLIPGFAGLRDLVNALGAAFAVQVRNVLDYANALVAGLLPALDLVRAAIQPVLDGLRFLREQWQGADAFLSSRLSGLAGGMQVNAAVDRAAAASAAVALQQRVAGSVQGQVDRITGAAGGSIDNSSQSATINQQNTFLGGTAREVTGAMDSMLRRARVAILGGDR